MLLARVRKIAPIMGSVAHAWRTIEENPQEHRKDYEAFVRDFNWFQARFYFFAVNIGVPEDQIWKPKQEIIDEYIEQTEHGIRLKDIR